MDGALGVIGLGSGGPWKKAFSAERKAGRRGTQEHRQECLCHGGGVGTCLDPSAPSRRKRGSPVGMTRSEKGESGAQGLHGSRLSVCWGRAPRTSPEISQGVRTKR